MNARMASIAIVAAMLLCRAATVDGSLIYTYLYPHQSVCFMPDDLTIIGKEDKVMVHYDFKGESKHFDGEVTMDVRTGTWYGPTISRVLSPSLDAISVDLVSGPQYRFCFEYKGSRPKIPIEVEIGRAQENHLVEAHEDKMDEYMDYVNTLEAGIAQVSDEVQYLQNRQKAFDSTVQSTYTRVLVFTSISVAVTVGSIGIQLFTIKRLFKEKKLV